MFLSFFILSRNSFSSKFDFRQNWKKIVRRDRSKFISKHWHFWDRKIRFIVANISINLSEGKTLISLRDSNSRPARSETWYFTLVGYHHCYPLLSLWKDTIKGCIHELTLFGTDNGKWYNTRIPHIFKTLVSSCNFTIWAHFLKIDLLFAQIQAFWLANPVMWPQSDNENAWIAMQRKFTVENVFIGSCPDLEIITFFQKQEPRLRGNQLHEVRMRIPENRLHWLPGVLDRVGDVPSQGPVRLVQAEGRRKVPDEQEQQHQDLAGLGQDRGRAEQPRQPGESFLTPTMTIVLPRQGTGMTRQDPRP